MLIVWRVRTKIFRVYFYLCGPAIRESLTAALHPEFGWWWREDEDGGRAIRDAEKRGWQECLASLQREGKL